jgi:hypothetical protein
MQTADIARSKRVSYGFESCRAYQWWKRPCGRARSLRFPVTEEATGSSPVTVATTHHLITLRRSSSPACRSPTISLPSSAPAPTGRMTRRPRID